MNPYRLVPLFLMLAAAQAAGQDRPYHAEVFAGGGAARVGGEEGSLGSGLCIVGGFGFRFAPKVSIELDVMTARHERDIAGGPLEGTATGVFGDIVYHFSEKRAHAFVMGSVGLLNSRSTHRYPSGGRVINVRSDDSHFAWGGGAGVTVFLNPKLSLRPQVRMIFSEATCSVRRA